MARKLKLTRPELKRQRDMLRRFERYLPMLKLKQQQLQLTLRQIQQQRARARHQLSLAQEKLSAYDRVLADRAGLDLRGLARPSQVATSARNVAGVEVPVFQGVSFPVASYSLFSTPAWVDVALADMRDVATKAAEVEIIDRQHDLLRRELSKIIQRVNLFEKLMIPQAREAIRVIRIHLGDQMTAAVGRAKIAKAKIAEAVTGETAADTLTLELAPGSQGL